MTAELSFSPPTNLCKASSFKSKRTCSSPSHSLISLCFINSRRTNCRLILRISLRHEPFASPPPCSRFRLCSIRASRLSGFRSPFPALLSAHSWRNGTFNLLQSHLTTESSHPTAAFAGSVTNLRSSSKQEVQVHLSTGSNGSATRLLSLRCGQCRLVRTPSSPIAHHFNIQPASPRA